MRAILLVLAVVGAAVALAGCSSDASEADAADAPPTTEATTEAMAPEEPAAARQTTIIMGSPSEFAMVPEATEVAAGMVTLDVVNEGAIEHEVVLIRTDGDSGALPTDASGAALEDAAVTPHGSEHGTGEGNHHAGVHYASGSGGTITVGLKPGRYAVVCNIPGHYQAGMHANLDVVPSA
jgi:uncharacterized cupredoxin-like copper-binding protein